MPSNFVFAKDGLMKDDMQKNCKGLTNYDQSKNGEGVGVPSSTERRMM